MLAINITVQVGDIPGLGPETYSRWRASTVGAITDTLQRRLIFELLGDVRGRSVLDVGCGDGDLAVELWKRGANVTGIDASRAMIEAARSRARREGAEITFCVADAGNMPFASKRFDIVAAVTILCFVENTAPMLQRLRGSCGPAGGS